jgi:hypothetical protein
MLFIISIGFGGAGFSQCNNDHADKTGQYWIEKIVKDCTSNPNMLKTTVTKCEFSKDISDGIPCWKIWVKADWIGKYTTLKYNISIYIEEFQKNGTSSERTIIYYTNYSNTLTYRCIDLSNTKPLKISDGTIQHTPYKEYPYNAVVK